MITLKNVTKVFENKGIERVTALRNVNLTFEDKGMVFISGFSGAGKSTLLSIIGGLDTPTSGNVIVDNYSFKNVSNNDLDRYRNNYVGFVFENVNLINSMSVEENIKVSCAFNGSNPTQSQVDYVIDKFKLTGLRNRKPGQLSMGQRQKVGVARALIKDPYIYLADDPTGHIDATRSDEIWAILKDISKKRLVLAVTHDKRIIDKYADRIITIDEGEVISDEEVSKSTSNSKKSAIGEILPDVSSSKSAKEIITQKHKFMFKDLFKLSANSLNYKKTRTFSIIFLTILAIMFFSLFSVMNNFDRELVMAKSVNQNKLDYVTFLKSDKSNVEDEEYEKIAKHYLIETSYTDVFKANKLIEYKEAKLSKENIYKNFDINYLVKQPNTSDKETCLGQKVLYGRKPNDSTNHWEWMISDYVANQIKIGLRLNSIEEVVGQVMNVDARYIANNPKVTIVGIYETNYKDYVNPETLELKGYKEHEFEYNKDYIYTVAMASENYINAVINQNGDRADFNVYGKQIQYSKEATSVNIPVCKTKSAKSDVLYIDGIDADRAISPKSYSLATGVNGNPSDVIVPISFFNKLFRENDLFKSSIESDIDINYLQENGFKSNDILKLSTQMELNLSFDGKNAKRFSIKGVTASDEFIVSDADFNRIFTGLNFSTVGMIVKSTASDVMLKDVILDLEEKGFDFTSTTSNKINEFDNNVRSFKLIFLWASVFAALFAIALIYFFVSSLINDRRRDIGVLRAFGARGRDVVSIFLFSGFVLKFIIFAFASLGTFLITCIGNSIARKQFGTLFSVFNLGVWDFVFICLMCLATIIIGTIIPIIKLSKKGPYENLRNYDG